PDPREWAWQRIPNWVKPLILITVLLCGALSFFLNIGKNFKDVFGNFIPTPTKTVILPQPDSVHIAREVTPFVHCMHDGHCGMMRKMMNHCQRMAGVNVRRNVNKKYHPRLSL
ncbi:MAG TPA: hypothetical protein VGD99_23030, partial [Anaerolineae bacterium]